MTCQTRSYSFQDCGSCSPQEDSWSWRTSHGVRLLFPGLWLSGWRSTLKEAMCMTIPLQRCIHCVSRRDSVSFAHKHSPLTGCGMAGYSVRTEGFSANRAGEGEETGKM